MSSSTGNVSGRGRGLCHNLCGKRGTLRCTRCRDASPPTLYCSSACQKRDWVFHKAYCGKTAYTFKLTLLGSSNPVITRTFDVPSWFTFRQLHYTIQYAMGPWQCCHLHEFTFSLPTEEPRTILSRRNDVLSIGPAGLDDDELFVMPGMPSLPSVHKESEETLLLKDAFDETGRLRALVAPNGQFAPLYYLYDFGDNWDHELTFKGSKLARAIRPLFSAATGCGPVEDCGGCTGWDDVKSAFAATRPSKDQLERRDWAREVSCLGQAFDPLKEPDITVMNYEGRWENHLNGFMEMSGEEVPNYDFEEDEYVI